MPNRHNSISLESLAPQSHKRTDAIQRDFAETAIGTIQTPEAIVGPTEVEQYLGGKYVAIIAQLEGKAREEYIARVTSLNTFKPLLGRLITRSEINEPVSVSRVISYIQSNI